MQDKRKIVTLQSVFESSEWQNANARLPLALGKDTDGNVIVPDLARMPHLLISGVTGSGKSVCMYSIILGLLKKYSPAELKFIMADLKVVELYDFKDLPHLQCPIANSCEETLTALQWCVKEINRRYQVMKNAQCRGIYQYNADGHPKLPYIVFVLDELSDLMVQEPEIAHATEIAINNICAKGRAAGVHLIILTSRADGKVLPFSMRTVIPAHIAFKLYSADNSCIMLGQPGGEKLERHGDMLIQLPSENTLLRCQGAYADNEMIKDFIDTLIPYKTPELDPLDQSIENMESVADEIKNFIYPGDTYGFLEAVKFVMSTGEIGTRYLQEHLCISYNRAAEYMDLLRERGVIQQNLPPPQEIVLEDFSIDDSEDISSKLQQYLRPGDTYGFQLAVELVISTGKATTSHLRRNLKIGYNRAAEYMDLLRERGVIKK